MKAIYKLLIKFTLFCMPFICFIVLYMYFDPFKVLKKYKSYYPTNVGLDRDYVSTQTFINNSTTYKYNSFIFGNSRSIFYNVDTWAKYINTTKCYHFDASGESLLGVYRKIKFLDDRNNEMSNVLIILDYTLIQQTKDKKEHLFISHPELSNQNYLSFQTVFFKTFLSKDFLIAYFDYKIDNKVKDYMKENNLLSDIPMVYNLKYNEIRYKYFEELISTNPSKYYDTKRMKLFYKRDSIQKFSPQIITKVQLDMFKEIRRIFVKRKTNYKIIINPLYDQLKINREDLKILFALFGNDNVFDFSGINYITNNYKNYYETSHYRPKIANFILNKIYK